ncbi:MAG: hypothetical protein K8R77_00230 [Anaerolineaceae bacterium]|nr:hypothetical protein [Anaerolineaceae bacterium]
MAFFTKLLFNKTDPLSFPVAATYVKIIAFGAALDASRRNKLSIPSSELIQWANEWLGPDFSVVEKSKSVVLYDQKHQRQWLDQPIQTFYEMLMKQSYLSILLRKLKKNELATVEGMAKAFSREIESYLIEHPDLEKLVSETEDVIRFDSVGTLWTLWLQAAEES